LHSLRSLRGLALLLDVVSAYAQSDMPELRQRCYAAGIMHGDDETDPSIIGIPQGPCRESYAAGRAYSQRMQQQSTDSMRQMDKLMQSACEDGWKLIANAEREGDRNQAEHLRALMPSECQRSGR
jgi:hypothetical protein